jgi:hypothetical protein
MSTPHPPAGSEMKTYLDPDEALRAAGVERLDLET